MDLAIDQTGIGARWSIAHGLAGLGLSRVSHVAHGAGLLRQRSCGRIVTSGGRLEAVYGRWWPHLGNMLQVLWDVNLRTMPADRCELYYHQPLSSPGFLTLSYVHTGPATSLATLYAATLVLDEIARLRQAQALVAHLTNDRISDRLMNRWGWQPHCLQWSGRHFIKRFYGEFPPIRPAWRTRLTLD